MSEQPFTPNDIHTIAGTGPYATKHPYDTGVLVLKMEDSDGVVAPVNASDYTVTPAEVSGGTGDVFLDAAFATAHAGKSLHILRDTPIDNDLVTQASEAERSTQAAVDRLTRAVQDVAAMAKRSPRFEVPYGGIDLTMPRLKEGQGIILKDGKLQAADFDPDAYASAVLSSVYATVDDPYLFNGSKLLQETQALAPQDSDIDLTTYAGGRFSETGVTDPGGAGKEIVYTSDGVSTDQSLQTRRVLPVESGRIYRAKFRLRRDLATADASHEVEYGVRELNSNYGQVTRSFQQATPADGTWVDYEFTVAATDYTGLQTPDFTVDATTRYLRLFVDACQTAGAAGDTVTLSYWDLKDITTEFKADETLAKAGGRVFDTIAAAVAATDIAVGDQVRTRGYHDAFDGGGAAYTIVAAATGTVDGGAYIDLSGIAGQLERNPCGIVNPLQWGARGIGGDDDTPIRNMLDWVAAVSQTYVFLQDAKNTYGGRMCVTGWQGKVFGMTKTYKLLEAHRNMSFQRLSLIAVDGEWADHITVDRTFNTLADAKASGLHVVGEFFQTLGLDTNGDGWGEIYEVMAAGTYANTDGKAYIDLPTASLQAKRVEHFFFEAGGKATYIDWDRVQFNCNRLTGGVQGRSRHRMTGCWMDRVRHVGVEGGGSDFWLDWCIIGQWTTNEVEYYGGNLTYSATLLRITESDTRVTNCVGRWAHSLCDFEATNNFVIGGHWFNGMQGYRVAERDAELNDDLDTYFGQASGWAAATDMVRRTEHLGFRNHFASGTLGAGEFSSNAIIGVYFDNLHHERFAGAWSFINCMWGSKDSSSLLSGTTLGVGAVTLYGDAPTRDYWIREHADEANAEIQLMVEGFQTFVSSAPRHVVRFQPRDGNTFAATTSPFNTDEDLNAARRVGRRQLADGFTLRPGYTHAFDPAQGPAFTLYGLGNKAQMGAKDANSTVLIEWGASGDEFTAWVDGVKVLRAGATGIEDTDVGQTTPKKGAFSELKVANWSQSADGADLTIAAGVITPTHDFHLVNGEGLAADDLVTINATNAHAGAILILQKAAGSGDVTVKHGTGNIICDSDFVLSSTDHIAAFVYNGSSWKRIAVAADNLIEHYASGNYTPDVVDQSANSIAFTKGVNYLRIGNQCTVSVLFANNIDTTGLTATDEFRLTLPFAVGKGGFSADVSFLSLAGGAPAGPYSVQAIQATSEMKFRVLNSATNLLVQDISSGVTDLQGLSLTYEI